MHIHIIMGIQDETGIRVSKRLREKIKRAAVMSNMSMVDYLDQIVPEIKMEVIKE